MATLHVKYHNESNDYDLTELFPQSRLQALGVSAEDVQGGSLSDVQVKQAVAFHLDAALTDFDSYVVERHENGNLTVRPEATFGRNF